MFKFIRKREMIVVFVVSLYAVLVFPTSGNAVDPPPKDRPAYQVELMKTMESAIKTLEAICKDKDLTQEEKEQKALEFTRNFRYGPDNKERLCIFTTKKNMVVNPYKPELEGKNLNDFRDSRDVSVFRKTSGIATEYGEGWIISPWPKLDGKGLAPRVSYIKVFEPLGWVLDIGLYIESIEGYEPPVFAGEAVVLDILDLDRSESPASGT